jgi:hypothetical protein
VRVVTGEDVLGRLEGYVNELERDEEDELGEPPAGEDAR